MRIPTCPPRAGAAAIRRGVPPAQAKALAAAADRNLDRLHRESAAREQAQRTLLVQALAKERAAVEAALKAEPGYKARKWACDRVLAAWHQQRKQAKGNPAKLRQADKSAMAALRQLVLQHKAMLQRA
jgi:hypothetical protein